MRFLISVSVSPWWERLSLGNGVLEFYLRKDSPLGDGILELALIYPPLAMGGSLLGI